MDAIEKFDPEIAEIIKNETIRQKNVINLIASENYASRAVMAAQGSLMTNKYAEGYPGKRYYGGCKFHDMAETVAIERGKKLFGAEHVNVQPHCGSQANMGVYLAVLKPGDTIMSMALDQGGHLSHGSPVNFSGNLYNIVPYHVSKETEQLDYDQLRALAKKSKPQMIVCGASAYPRIIDFKAFREIADEVGAYLLADIAHIAGLVVSGVHPSPVGIADFVTTTTHKTLRGPRGGMIMCSEDMGPVLDKAVFPGMQGGPLMHAITAKAVAFKEALSPEFKTYNEDVVKNCKILAEKMMDYDFNLVSGGTDNHLFVVNLQNKGISGRKAEKVLQRANIILNRSTVPFDPLPPFKTSGVRIGTAPVTTRGMAEKEMGMIADWINRAIDNHKDKDYIAGINEEVAEVCNNYPAFAGEE